MKTTSGCTAFFPLRSPLFHCAGTFFLEENCYSVSKLRVSEMAVGTTRYCRTMLYLCKRAIQVQGRRHALHDQALYQTPALPERARSLSQSTLRSARCPLHNLTAGVKNVLTKYLTEGVISQKHGGSSNTTRPGFPDLISRPFTQFCIIHTSSL